MKMFTLSEIINNDDMHKITSEFSRLRDVCYLDNTGAALYPQSIIEKVNSELINNVYMNPHSDSNSHERVKEIRNIILEHFNTNSSQYQVIFTSGATQSLKLVMESFQFNNDGNVNSTHGAFIYLRDNHTSVLGLREIAKMQNVDVIYLAHEDFLESLKSPYLGSFVGSSKDKGNNLFIYPAQNNFNGFKYPVNQIKDIKSGCIENYIQQKSFQKKNNWYVLLDAASYVSTNRLDLSSSQPDFVCLSFYKIFGYPTGLGALLVKNDSIDLLKQKKYYGGGTVDIVLNTENFHAKKENVIERFEDGTNSFLSITTLKHCFDVMNNLIPKVINNNIMDTISGHTFYLAKNLYDQLKKLRHENGYQVVKFYMDSDFTNTEKQGGVVTFNLLRDDGTYVGHTEVEKNAEKFNIKIRTGCFCNSGSCQRHFKMTNEYMKTRYEAGYHCNDEIDLIDGIPTGALRISFGYYNTYKDVHRILSMILQCYVITKIPRPELETELKKLMASEKLYKIQENRYKNKIKIDNVYNNNSKDTLSKAIKYKNGVDAEIKLSEIYIHPVEHCGPLRIKSSWKISHKGFQYDNDWRIVTKNGVCLTRQQNPIIAEIYPIIDLKSSCMTLHYKGTHSSSIPLDTSLLCPSENVADGFDCGNQISDWLSDIIGIPYLRLIRKYFINERSQDKRSTENIYVVIINTPTIQWIKKSISEQSFQVDLTSIIDEMENSLRAKIIIDAKEAEIERNWCKILIKEHEFKVEGHFYGIPLQRRLQEQIEAINKKFHLKLLTDNFFYGTYLSYTGSTDETKSSDLVVGSPVEVIPNNYCNLLNSPKNSNFSNPEIISEEKQLNILSKFAKHVLNHRKKYTIN